METETGETGLAAIDQEHRELLQMIPFFQAQLSAGKGVLEVGHLVGWVVPRLQAHFKQEETVMAGAGFPHLAAHQARHQELLCLFEEVVAHFEREGATQSLCRMVVRLLDMLRQHIKLQDAQMGQFLRTG